MALSPWHVASRLSLDDVAALMTGFDISLAKTGNIHDHEIKEYEEWCRIIVTAAKDNELRPCAVDVLVEESQFDPNPDTDEMTGEERFGYVITGHHWRHCDVADSAWKKEPIRGLRLMLYRQEVYRWLKASGVDDEDIPDALRIMPVNKKAEKADSDTQNHPSALAVIAALLKLLQDESRPRYNQTSIAAAIQESFPYRGFSESQLQKLFSHANRELKERSK